MVPPTVCLIYSVHPTREQARETARALLDATHVACCNILPAMESHYAWEGTREQASEVAMLSKTMANRVAAAMDVIRALHPATCPAILHWAADGGYPPFIDWITASAQPLKS